MPDLRRINSTQRTRSHGEGLRILWDVNGDGIVDQSDVQEVTSNLGPCEDPDNCPWDVNGDGVVNGQDVQAVATHFGPCPLSLPKTPYS